MAFHEPHTVTDVADLGLDTVIQNTSGKFILVYGSLELKLLSAGDAAYIDIFTDASSSPTTLVQSVGWRSLNTDVDQQLYLPFSFIVQPNHYYLLTSNTSGGATIGLHTILEYTE